MQAETQKILGTLQNGAFVPLNARVSAHCNRVAVADGHMVNASIQFSNKPTVRDSARGGR